MEAPRDVDLRALNAFLGDVESAADSELVAVVVGGLAVLVPCDCVLYTRARTADDTRAGAYSVIATDACIEADRNAQQSLWFRLIELDEHPVVSYWGRTRDPTPIRVSDVATRRQFHRCGIYDLFLRNWGSSTRSPSACVGAAKCMTSTATEAGPTSPNVTGLCSISSDDTCR
jgi:hypothetical protein